jgi:Alpha-lytic protease prodomain
VADTDDKAARTTKAAGAMAAKVSRSMVTLDAITGEFDALAQRDIKTSAGVAGWHVDPRCNAVVVTTIKGQQGGEVLATASATATQ